MKGKLDERSALKETSLPEETPRGKKFETYEIGSQETRTPKPKSIANIFTSAALNSRLENVTSSPALDKASLKGSKTVNLKNLRGKVELLYERLAID